MIKYVCVEFIAISDVLAFDKFALTIVVDSLLSDS